MVARCMCSVAAGMLAAAAHAQPATPSLNEVVAVNGFVNCLSWTRGGVEIASLAEEGKLVQETAPRELPDLLWSRDFQGGSLILKQHNDGSRACTVIVFGVAPDEFVGAVESVIRQSETRVLDFEARSEETSGATVTRMYRQKSDQHISMTVSTNSDGLLDNGPTGILTFYFAD